MKANIYLKKNLLNQNEIQKLKQDFSEFEQEKKLNNWNIKSITSSEYKNFLEDVYKRLNIQNHPSLNNLIIAKQLTEVISFFGKYDQLSFQRINYFNEKIKYYQNLKKKDFDIDLRKTENRKTIEYNNNFFNNKNNNNINVHEYYSNNNDNNNKNNKNINKNNEEKDDIKTKKKKVKFNRKIDVINVECWKKYNSENTVEPNVNNSKDTTKCTCEIF